MAANAGLPADPSGLAAINEFETVGAPLTQATTITQPSVIIAAAPAHLETWGDANGGYFTQALIEVFNILPPPSTIAVNELIAQMRDHYPGIPDVDPHGTAHLLF